MKMEKWDLLKLFQEWGRGDQGEWWRGKFDYDIFKNFCKCHNGPPVQQYDDNKKKKKAEEIMTEFVQIIVKPQI
jgi:hypothetical protein